MPPFDHGISHEDLPVSESFVDYLKEQEGWRSSTYTDRGRLNAKTVGFGHRPLPGEKFDKPLTLAQGHQILFKDILIHHDKAARYVNQRFGDGSWESLGPLQREALTDYAFNPGIRSFPNLTRAVVEGDRFRLAKEFRRWFGPDDQKEELTKRNKAWWAKYGKKLTGIKYRDTKSVDKLVDFFDSVGVYAGDL
jgi:GH24 family phage-related lysozyme (muramidase)